MTNEQPGAGTSQGTARLAALRELAALTRQNVRGKALRDSIVALCARMFDADAVALWRFESREHVWRIAAASGLSSDYTTTSIPGNTDVDELIPDTMFIADVDAWPAIAERSKLYETEHIRSFLLLPLHISGETAGTLCCYYRTADKNVTNEDLALAATFSELASVALSTEQFDQLADVARDIAGRREVSQIVQRITDAATALTGSQFGAFFYNVVDDRGEAYTLYTISGVPREAFSRFPMPRKTEVFAPTFDGTGVVRSANIHKDPRYGHNSPYHGMPAGHLPVVSYLAVPVVTHEGEVLGGLFFGHSAEGVFGETEERVAIALAGHATAAIENARLYERLDRDRAALHRSEIRYRSLVQATPTRQAIGITTRNGMMEEDSPSWRDLTGQTFEQMRGRGWLDAVHPSHREKVAAAWDRAIEETSLFEEEWLLRMKDSSYRWFSGKAVPVREDDGSVLEWIGTTTDINEQHVAQEGVRFLAQATELFASSLDYRETLKNVTFLAVPRIADWCAVDVPDPTGEHPYQRLAVAHVDPSKVRLAEELQQKYPPKKEIDAVYRVLTTGQAELVPEIPDEMIVQAAQSPEHLQILRDLGLMSYMIVPLRSRGEVVGAVTFVATDRRFSEHDLIHAEELAFRAAIAIENAQLYGAAQAASRAKDEFLATLSHELRTPMTSVLGWARMLKLGLSPQEAEVAIDAIEKSASAQAQLIEDVLDVSRIMSGKLTFTPRKVDVASVAQAALTTVHPAALAKGIEILTSIPPAVPPIAGDEGRLQQVIWNLVSNAIKFTPRGGSVTVRVAHIGSIIRITVTDTGQGIERAFLPYVFEPFRQADSSTTRSHGGIGLGLAIVRSLVEMHGGSIRATSEGLGRGATFTVDLPIVEASPAIERGLTTEAVSAPRSSVMPSLAGLSVLVIDDQEYTRDVLTAILRRAGAAIAVAESVQEGLRKFEEVTPHVVVCDIAMPEEDGYVFLRTLRARKDAASATPVLALTAFGRPEDRRHALDAGFDSYLKKPVDPVELAEAIQLLIVRK